MYCASKAAKTTQCTVHCDLSVQDCEAWNRGRPEEGKWEDEVLAALAMRCRNLSLQSGFITSLFLLGAFLYFLFLGPFFLLCPCFLTDIIGFRKLDNIVSRYEAPVCGNRWDAPLHLVLRDGQIDCQVDHSLKIYILCI